MTEEEVNAKFLEMNQEIFTNKLNIDLDKCYKNLIVVFNNVISAFKKDMELRIYEISFDSESILSREEIGNKIEGLFSKFRDYITKTVNRDEE
jgi:activator of HSP90 ATPase